MASLSCIHSRPGTPQSPEHTEFPNLAINIFYAARNHSNIRLCKSNCRSIQVDIILPVQHTEIECLRDSNSNDEDLDCELRDDTLLVQQATSQHPCASIFSPASAPNSIEKMSPDMSFSPLAQPQQPHSTSSSQNGFPFLSLPLELRLKIYGLLLPPRHHKITTQIPHNGYYFTPGSTPSFAAQSFYPVSPDAPTKLTTYKVLTSNSHPNFPQASIHTSIFSVSKQVKAEAEQVLYGHSGNVWDFGMNVEAIKPFFSDRSVVARQSVKSIRIARDISMAKIEKDVVWQEFCDFVRKEMIGLKSLDMTVWGRSEIPPPAIAGQNVEASREEVHEKSEGDENACREWEYIMELVGNEGLKHAKITWWGFAPGVESFLAKWMLDSCHLKEQVLQNGEVIEGIVVLKLDKTRV